MFTPEFFDALVILNIIVGVILAAWRLRKDFTRPYPPPRRATHMEQVSTTRSQPNTQNE